jgi:hypothetical protein
MGRASESSASPFARMVDALGSEPGVQERRPLRRTASLSALAPVIPRSQRLAPNGRDEPSAPPASGKRQRGGTLPSVIVAEPPPPPKRQMAPTERVRRRGLTTQAVTVPTSTVLVLLAVSVLVFAAGIASFVWTTVHAPHTPAAQAALR